MKFLKDFNFNDKKVILKSDLCVPLDARGKIADDFTIRRAIPTIRHLLENRAQIFLIKGNVLVAKRLSQLLDQEINFVKNTKALIKSKSNITLLDSSCELGNLDFGDIYINDCFAYSHIESGLILGNIERGAGLLLEEEINMANSVLKDPARPLIAILGGAKVGSKIPALIKFLEHADHVLIGGVLAPAILHSKKMSLSYVEVEPEVEEILKDLELTNPKLHMPVDALVGLKDMRQDYLRKSGAGKIRLEEQMFDIGPETVRMFSDIIATAATVVWHGPMGMIEDERFANGTLSIASAVLRSNAFTMVGGSHTSAFLAQNNLRGKFSHVSTGGSAMLEYFVKQELPGIKDLS